MQRYSIAHKRYAYLEHKDKYETSEEETSKDVIEKMLMTVGREIIRERSVTNEELEQKLEGLIGSDEVRSEERGDDKPIISYLREKGYLKEGDKILRRKGFDAIGKLLLRDIMSALKEGDFGMHETTRYGYGTTMLDTSREYEAGDDLRLLNTPKTLLNAVQRLARHDNAITIPLDINIDDLEVFESVKDIRTAIVYCIDLSSTMRYSTSLGDMSRIEVAKRALWSLYILNEKFFPTDSIHVIGFGALAAKVKPSDIPYLKTFEPGNDFLHYTNYQSAFRLASKILEKDPSNEKRLVLITDGHPSACFIDNELEKEKILNARSYAHFYQPDKNTLERVEKGMNMHIDTNSGDLVYLCYRYKKVDGYIGDKTIAEAKKCYRKGIAIDTVMISEEDSLLSYINDMEKHVKGRSYYINPANLDKMLITDYILNKRNIIDRRRV